MTLRRTPLTAMTTLQWLDKLKVAIAGIADDHPCVASNLACAEALCVMAATMYAAAGTDGNGNGPLPGAEIEGLAVAAYAGMRAKRLEIEKRLGIERRLWRGASQKGSVSSAASTASPRRSSRRSGGMVLK